MEWHTPAQIGISTWIYVGIEDGIGLFKVRMGQRDGLPTVLVRGPLRHISIENTGFYTVRCVLTYSDGTTSDMAGTWKNQGTELGIEWGKEVVRWRFFEKEMN